MLANLTSQFCDQKILLLGDLMLDSYTIGSVSRVSPEAPVCVLKVQEEKDQPGGAGNVALGIKALGSSPLLVGRVGADIAGQRLKQALQSAEVDPCYLLSDDSRTIIKNRMVGSGQQMLRVDLEELSPLTKNIEKEACLSLRALLPNCRAVGISDYAKGFLSDELLRLIIEESKHAGVPVLVDPKGMDFLRYKGATLIKPNLLEAYQAAGLGSQASLDEVGNALLKQTQADYILITRSKDGMTLYSADQRRQDFPALLHEVVDVTGAGDTVLACLLASLANGLDAFQAVSLANTAASLAVQHFGCAAISLKDLTEALLFQSSKNKVFKGEKLSPLVSLLQGRPYSLLTLSLDTHSIIDVYHQIEELPQPLVVNLEGKEVSDAELSVISSLQEVYAVLLGEKALTALQEQCPPSQSFQMQKKGQLTSV